jgi:UDP-N-acetylglucosamine 2-epimerase (non-hydrolysing)
MIDSLVNFLPRVNRVDVSSSFQVEQGNYTLVTLHRPSNVDSTSKLKEYLKTLNKISDVQPVIFPVHPRTKSKIQLHGLDQNLNMSLRLIDPVGYIDFLALVKNAAVIITDSGGIQEESTFLGVQCITCRDNTERPVTVDIGTNHLIGTDPSKIHQAALDILSGKYKKGMVPEFWDGKTSERIVRIIRHKL